MQVYGNLIAEIAKRGLSKTEIAEFLGISRNTLYTRLTCKSKFKKDEFDALCEEFFADLPINYLSEKIEIPHKRSTA